METPAQKAKRLFGGLKALSDVTGVSEIQVRKWDYPRERGGCDGLIPQRHHQRLIDEAHRRGIDFTRHDLTSWISTGGEAA